MFVDKVTLMTNSEVETIMNCLISAYTQQIIINSSEELLKDPFLPLAERVKKRTESLFHKEESLRGFLKSSTDDTSQVV